MVTLHSPSGEFHKIEVTYQNISLFSSLGHSHNLVLSIFSNGHIVQNMSITMKSYNNTPGLFSCA